MSTFVDVVVKVRVQVEETGTDEAIYEAEEVLRQRLDRVDAVRQFEFVVSARVEDQT